MTEYWDESGGSGEVFPQHSGNVEVCFAGIQGFHVIGISRIHLQLPIWNGICVETKFAELDPSLMRQLLLHPGPAEDYGHNRGEEGNAGLRA